MSILHYKTVTIADGTNSDIVRPSDWGSAHQQVLNIGGNTAGTSQISGADIVWAGGNNVTLSANGSTVSVVGPSLAAYLTTAAQSNHSHNLATTTTNGSLIVVGTTNSNGATIAVPSFLTTAGATNAITTAALSNHSHNFATTTTGGALIVVGTTNSAGATIGVPSFLTTAALSQNTSNYAGIGTTFAGTNATATLAANTNGVALSLSVAGGGVINQTGPNIAVAGSTVTSGDVYFSNSPTVTFGMAGSTITASAAGGGGGGVTVGKWEPFDPVNSTTSIPANNNCYFQRLQPDQNISFSYIERRLSNSASSTNVAATGGHTIDYGLYSRGAGASSTQMELIGSSRIVMAVSMSSSTASWNIGQGGVTNSWSSTTTTPSSLFTGLKHLYMPFTSTMSAGQEYWVGMRVSSSGSSQCLRLGFWEQTVVNNLTVGKIYGTTASASNSTYVGDFNQGVYSTTSANLPGTVQFNQISNAVSQARMYLQFDDGV